MQVIHFPSQVFLDKALFARVYSKRWTFVSCQGKFDKCTRNTSMVLANKKRPCLQIKVFKTTFRAHKQRNLSREICQGKPVDRESKLV
jgi:hypothetical protein